VCGDGPRPCAEAVSGTVPSRCGKMTITCDKLECSLWDEGHSKYKMA
jgi:hypothetical protein